AEAGQVRPDRADRAGPALALVAVQGGAGAACGRPRPGGVLPGPVQQGRLPQPLTAFLRERPAPGAVAPAGRHAVGVRLGGSRVGHGWTPLTYQFAVTKRDKNPFLSDPGGVAGGAPPRLGASLGQLVDLEVSRRRVLGEAAAEDARRQRRAPEL